MLDLDACCYVGYFCMLLYTVQYVQRGADVSCIFLILVCTRFSTKGIL